VVIYAASFTLIYSLWTGACGQSDLARRGSCDECDEATLFRKVIWPGALPYMITGLPSVANCWRA
jgi:ABC-type nitrate/sulfonate/bicarbonate transport system permease component